MLMLMLISIYSYWCVCSWFVYWCCTDVWYICTRYWHTDIDLDMSIRVCTSMLTLTFCCFADLLLCLLLLTNYCFADFCLSAWYCWRNRQGWRGPRGQACRRTSKETTNCSRWWHTRGVRQTEVRTQRDSFVSAPKAGQEHKTKRWPISWPRPDFRCTTKFYCRIMNSIPTRRHTPYKAYALLGSFSIMDYQVYYSK